MNAHVLHVARNAIGFNALMEELTKISQSNNFPPYDVRVIQEEGQDERYAIDIAVAGFQMDDLEITKERSLLSIEGKRKATEQEGVSYSHQGIAKRDFRLKFSLHEYIQVDGANLENGLLTIKLIQVIPEEAKARKIEISA